MRIASALLPVALLAARADAQSVPPVPPAAPVMPSREPFATIVAEPVALLIAACDSDGDARVTRAELSACITRGFIGDPAQGNSIGYIGYADWALKWLGDRNALPSPFSIDVDHDNRITLAEMQAQFATLFTRFDTDRDGVLTRAELLTIRAGTGGGEPGGRGRGRGRGRREAEQP